MMKPRQRELGLPLWAWIVLAYTVVVCGIWRHGWRGLPAEHAPLGFAEPECFLILAMAVAIVIGRWRAEGSVRSPESAGLLVGCVGGCLSTHVNPYALYFGLLLLFVGPLVVPPVYSRVFGKKTGTPGRGQRCAE
jgi:hypothetical protein